jgi:hypothetical protein
LANFLAREKVTYEQFGNALELLNSGDMTGVSWADEIAFAFKAAIDSAAEIARKHQMSRAFAIAPTASCSYKSKDLEGNTCTPEIMPPIARLVDRDSDTFGVQAYDYGNVEIASEVGWDAFKKVADNLLILFQETGLFHGYSFNSWSDVVTYDNDFILNWLDSPQTSLYYSLQVMPDTQNKTDALAALSEDYRDLFGFGGLDTSKFEDDEEVSGFCPSSCTSCAE